MSYIDPRDGEKAVNVSKGPRPNSLSFWVRVGFLTYILDSLVDSLEVFSLTNWYQSFRLRDWTIEQSSWLDPS